MSNEADVVVIVDDVNDNAPSFDVTSKLFGIPSTAAAYTVVTTLKVSAGLCSLLYLLLVSLMVTIVIGGMMVTMMMFVKGVVGTEEGAVTILVINFQSIYWVRAAN